MRLSDWIPIYDRILEDMGYSKDDDASSIRVLEASTLNSDLVDPDDIRHIFGKEVTVYGNAPGLESDISRCPSIGTRVASGSSVGRLLSLDITPDVVVTDLDGDMAPQLEASARGCLTFMHAHGDNMDAIRQWAGMFEGPVILTTQGVPRRTVFNFGGFTDGDRAVCISQEMGAERALLLGFDYDRPMDKDGSDPGEKLRKLQWARRIIEGLEGIEIIYP